MVSLVCSEIRVPVGYSASFAASLWKAGLAVKGAFFILQLRQARRFETCYFIHIHRVALLSP